MVQYNNRRICLVFFAILFLRVVSPERAFCAEKIDWKDSKPKTGNRLAILEFSSEGVSEPIRSLLTDQFRLNIKNLKMYEVLDRSMTNQVEIFYPGEEIYGECKSKGCIMELGKMLKVNYVIAGSIIEKKNEYFVKGRLFSIDMQQEVQGFSMENITAVDSIRLEMKKLAYNVSGLEVPDTLTISASSSTLSSNVLKKEQKRRKWITLPKIPSKVKSLIFSAAIPGAGQMYSKRTYTGLGFMGTEIVIGGLALLAHSSYQKSWGGFESTYDSYQQETDPGTLIKLRPKIIQYASDTKRYNSFLKGLRAVGASVWGFNMLHAYIVGPDDIFVRTGDPGSFTEIGAKPRLTTWDVLSGFGVKGAILRPLIRGSSLSAYSAYTDAGYTIVTPIGLYFGSVFTSLTFESSNYSFSTSNFDQSITGTSFTTAFSFDFTEKISFGGKDLRKYMFIGRSNLEDGKGYVLGGDFVYDIGSFPLSFALISRANLVSTASLGTSMWITLGVNLGLDIP